MKKTPNVLFVSINFFCPEFLDGGNKIVYNLIKKNDEFTPTFLSLFCGSYTSADESTFSHIRTESILENKSSKLLKMLKILAWFFLFRSRVCLPHLFAKRIAKKIIASEAQYDAIHLTSLSLAVVLDFLPDHIKRKTVLSAVDSYSMFMERRLKTEKTIFRRFITRIEYKRGLKFELKYYPMPGAVLFVSIVDSNFIQNMLKASSNIFHIPLGVDTDYFKKECAFDSDSFHVIFTGNLSYGPNKNACLFLAKEVLPKLLDNFPDLKMVLAGSNPPRELNQYKSSNLIITGFVDDLRPHIDRSHLFVSPLMFGAGMKYKALEAFSMEKICLCSPITVDGINCQDGTHCIIEPHNDAASWANSIVSILKNIEKYSYLGSNSRQLIQDHYSWSAMRAQYKEIYKKLSSER